MDITRPFFIRFWHQTISKLSARRDPHLALSRLQLAVRVKVRFRVQKYLGFNQWRHSEPFIWEKYRNVSALVFIHKARSQYMQYAHLYYYWCLAMVSIWSQSWVVKLTLRRHPVALTRAFFFALGHFTPRNLRGRATTRVSTWWGEGIQYGHLYQRDLANTPQFTCHIWLNNLATLYMAPV